MDSIENPQSFFINNTNLFEIELEDTTARVAKNMWQQVANKGQRESLSSNDSTTSCSFEDPFLFLKRPEIRESISPHRMNPVEFKPQFDVSSIKDVSEPALLNLLQEHQLKYLMGIGTQTQKDFVQPFQLYKRPLKLRSNMPSISEKENSLSNNNNSKKLIEDSSKNTLNRFSNNFLNATSLSKTPTDSCLNDLANKSSLLYTKPRHFITLKKTCKKSVDSSFLPHNVKSSHINNSHCKIDTSLEQSLPKSNNLQLNPKNSSDSFIVEDCLMEDNSKANDKIKPTLVNPNVMNYYTNKTETEFNKINIPQETPIVNSKTVIDAYLNNISDLKERKPIYRETNGNMRYEQRNTLSSSWDKFTDKSTNIDNTPETTACTFKGTPRKSLHPSLSEPTRLIFSPTPHQSNRDNSVNSDEIMYVYETNPTNQKNPSKLMEKPIKFAQRTSALRSSSINLKNSTINSKIAPKSSSKITVQGASKPLNSKMKLEQLSKNKIMAESVSKKSSSRVSSVKASKDLTISNAVSNSRRTSSKPTESKETVTVFSNRRFSLNPSLAEKQGDNEYIGKVIESIMDKYQKPSFRASSRKTMASSDSSQGSNFSRAPYTCRLPVHNSRTYGCMDSNETKAKSRSVTNRITERTVSVSSPRRTRNQTMEYNKTTFSTIQKKETTRFSSLTKQNVSTKLLLPTSTASKATKLIKTRAQHMSARIK